MKSMKAALLIAVAATKLLGGCREEVARVATDQATETTGPRSCTKFDLCYTCGMDFNGKLSCGFKLSSFCPGTQQATVRQTPMRIEYDDGTFEDYTAVETLAADLCS